MKRAVLCIAHKAPEQLNVLIKQFLADAPETDIYFHIDKKAENIKDGIMKHPQVFLSKTVTPSPGETILR